jgi:sulfate transport system substrate-binding protein
VKAGLNADIVALSLAPDVDELVAAGLVDRKWSRQSYRGIVTNSLVVFVVRDGNPKKIRGWNDLVRAGVDVVTPNPFTSGGARWNVMAAYGAQRKLGKTDKQAQDYLLKLFRNVVSQDKSARDSLQTFNAGRGDVLLAYENEALFAQSRGQKLPFVIPRSTILIENPIAVLKTSEHKQEATAFLRFLRTPGAQRTFAENGYRPVSKAVASEFPKKFPARPGQFTIDQLGLGGWDKVQKRFFDARTGVMARIEREVGGVTG